MKLIFIYFKVLLILLIFASCKNEDRPLSTREQTLANCMNDMVFTCDSSDLGNVYFKGKINGQDFCVSYPNNEYWYYNGIATQTVTSVDNPILNSGGSHISTFYDLSISPPIFDHAIGIPRDFSPRVQISSPSTLDSTAFKGIYYLEKYFKEGNLTMRNPSIDKFNGWDFSISWGCVWIPGYGYYKEKDELNVPFENLWLSPIVESQNDMVFEISNLNIGNDLTNIYYDVTFKIECDLFFRDRIEGKPFYGRLEEGEFRTQIVVEK